MIAIVRIALSRPYTFIVLALLIAIFGVLAAIRTATDIFPNIDIPVISVVWTYTGLPPDDMSGRVVYYYERTLSAQVNDIEHIESQSLPGYGVVKVFFQKNVNINSALAQVTAASQTVLKLLPPGITPPYVLSYNASSVPSPVRRYPSSSFSIWGRTSSGRNWRPWRALRSLLPTAEKSGRSR
jgi:multidrug efflux pump subunit AcrB